MKKTDLSKWPILFATEQVDETPRRVRLADLASDAIKAIKTKHNRTAIVMLKDGAPRAFDAQCPHMGADLGKAICIGDKGDIACPWHGYVFSSNTGELLRNPNENMMKNIRVASASFDPQIKQRYRLREYQVEITDGWVSIK